MQLHTLKLKNKRKKRKTIGRGGKKGTYSGKGMKGQKSRSGAHVKPMFEGGRSTLIDRMKKKRGFKSPHIKKVIVQLSAIDKKFKDGDEVTLESLISVGLIDKIEAKAGIKVLGLSGQGGKDIKKHFTFGKNISLSKSAAKAAKKSGSANKEQ